MSAIFPFRAGELFPHTAVRTQNPILVLQVESNENLTDSIAAGVRGNYHLLWSNGIDLGNDLLLKRQSLGHALSSLSDDHNTFSVNVPR